MLETLVNSQEDTTENETKASKTWKWILIDSIIIALIAMFAVTPEVIPDIDSAWVMFKAFLIAFIFQLAIERGLKR